MRDEILRSIGGQLHVQCEEQHMPLNASTARYDHCS